MRCIHITSRKALLILFSFLINGVQHSQMADNSMDISTKDHSSKNTTSSDLSATQGFIRQYHIVKKNVNQGDVSYCPLSEDKKDCSQLSAECWRCELNYSCTYGEELLAKCSVLDPTMKCKGDKTFHIPYVCRYCYQTESWEHICTLKANCNSIATSRSPYMTNCTVKEDVLCLGKRTFFKNVLCNWTGGYRWSTALILSVTLGGFGADRFYLGHWQEGIGKLFSFGGLGVWTLIDVILISLHYLGPADGSLYI